MNPDAPRDRERYHHGELRQALMNAACRHIAADGTESLSLRALAREAGVSPTAPYRHFQTRNSLLAAIATVGFDDLRRALETATAGLEADPVEALRRSGAAYVHYAVDHPVHYNLMFGSVLADFSQYEGLSEAGEASFETVLAVLRSGRRRGVFEDLPLEELAAVVWSGVHGVASLLLNTVPMDHEMDKKMDKKIDNKEPTAVRVMHRLASEPLSILDRLVFDGIKLAQARTQQQD